MTWLLILDWVRQPTLRSQAHWLVTKNANAQPKPANELAYPNAWQTGTKQQIDEK